eukprot:s245_g6.t13
MLTDPFTESLCDRLPISTCNIDRKIFTSICIVCGKKATQRCQCGRGYCNIGCQDWNLGHDSECGQASTCGPLASHGSEPEPISAGSEPVVPRKGIVNVANSCDAGILADTSLHIFLWVQSISSLKSGSFGFGKNLEFCLPGYLAALIQCLRSIPEAPLLTESPCFRSALEVQNELLVPTEVVDVVELLGFQPGRHQDCAEVFEALLESTVLLASPFYCYYVSELACNHRLCHWKGTSHEEFALLPLCLTEATQSVADALSAFLRGEQLSSDNTLECPKCSRRVQATKRLRISMAPDILGIHLKRFRPGHFGKVRTFVEFAETLELPMDGGESVRYKLRSVITHRDQDGCATAGRYVAYAQESDHSWVECDDTEIKPVPLGMVLASAFCCDESWWGRHRMGVVLMVLLPTSVEMHSMGI